MRRNHLKFGHSINTVKCFIGVLFVNTADTEWHCCLRNAVLNISVEVFTTSRDICDFVLSVILFLVLTL